MCFENFENYINIIFSQTEGDAVNPSQKLSSDPKGAAMTTILIRVLKPDYHRRINWSMETDTHTQQPIRSGKCMCDLFYLY